MKSYRLIILSALFLASLTVWAATSPFATLRRAPTVEDLRRLADYSGIYAEIFAPFSATASARFAGRAEAFDEIADWLEESQVAQPLSQPAVPAISVRQTKETL